MKSYILTDLDEDFWSKVKMLAAERKITIKSLILDLLKQEVTKIRNELI